MYTTEPHVNEKFKNQSLLWHSTDTKERFEENRKANRLGLWHSVFNIEYKFNSYGFRADEFSNTDNIVSLGCSFTLGVGIPAYQTWANIVSKTLGLANFNLAIDGASADCCFRMAANWIPQLNPKVILYQNPEPSRMEWFDGYNSVPHNLMSMSTNHSLLYKAWVMNEKNLTMNYLKNLYAIKYLANSIGALFVHIPLEKINRIDSARDITATTVSHFGPKTHSAVADTVLRRLDWPKR